jgi:hypothetical protein
MPVSAISPNIRPDSYYEDEARAAIERAIDECDSVEAEQISFAIRRAYPFGPIRSSAGSREYKIWNKLVNAYEQGELGLPPRKHKRTVERERLGIAPPVASRKPKKGFPIKSTSAEQLSAEVSKPVDANSASIFLRRFCVATVTMLEDCDRLRVVMKNVDSDENKIKAEYTIELATNDPAARERSFVKAAQRMYRAWFEAESEKF